MILIRDEFFLLYQMLALLVQCSKDKEKINTLFIPSELRQENTIFLRTIKEPEETMKRDY